MPAPSAAEAAEAAAREKAKDAKAKDGSTKDAAKEDKPKKKLPESQAIEIVLELPRARPTEVVAYRGARLVTMKGDEVIEDGTIVVDGNRIKAIGASASVTVPPARAASTSPGSTVIPGLIDEHAHLHYSTLDVFPQRPWKYVANLAYGVTTDARSVGQHARGVRRRRRWSRPA